MDPLSITTACLTLLSAVGKTSLAITSFIRGCREARSDLTSISGELTQLHLVLDLLKDDTSVSDGRVIPESLQLQILSIIKNCSLVVDNINSVLQKHEGKTGVAKWVAFGKSEVAGLRMSLEAHRGSLSLVLELVSVSMARAVLEDVGVVRGDMRDIKQDTSQIPQIMAELERLRAVVTGGGIPGSGGATGGNYVLEQYLDSLTSYAETVCGDVVWDSEGGSGVASRRSSREAPRVDGEVGEQATASETVPETGTPGQHAYRTSLTDADLAHDQSIRRDAYQPPLVDADRAAAQPIPRNAGIRSATLGESASLSITAASTAFAKTKSRQEPAAASLTNASTLMAARAWAGTPRDAGEWIAKFSEPPESTTPNRRDSAECEEWIYMHSDDEQEPQPIEAPPLVPGPSTRQLDEPPTVSHYSKRPLPRALVQELSNKPSGTALKFLAWHTNTPEADVMAYAAKAATAYRSQRSTEQPKLTTTKVSAHHTDTPQEYIMPEATTAYRPTEQPTPKTGDSQPKSVADIRRALNTTQAGKATPRTPSTSSKPSTSRQTPSLTFDNMLNPPQRAPSIKLPETIVSILISGDGAVGKTKLLTALTTGQYRSPSTPTVMPRIHPGYHGVEVDGKSVGLTFVEDYLRVCPNLTRSFFTWSIELICFAIDSPDSLENAKEKLGSSTSSRPPFVLVGLKKDLQDDPGTIEVLQRTGQHPVSRQEGARVAGKIGAHAYYEVSARTMESVMEVFEFATRLGLRQTSKKKHERFRSLFGISGR